MPGAHLGDGVIVGAGSVVGGKVADYSIVAGNRATIQRARFSPEDIKRIKLIAWWNWLIQKILANEGAIAGDDIDALEAACE
ncbi:hypothetical protein [Planktotalea sp.]|uniref:hypothetical protein n=1 Tax=Planktotalea sp. TaxID=2029877 RepID=UPI0025CD8A66|nr:hypothetical protein [Planktotalea sp.]